MRVSKWGNSLAIRLPTAVVEALDLKDGDEIEIRVTRKREFKVGRPSTGEGAIESLRPEFREALMDFHVLLGEPMPITFGTHRIAN